MTSQPPTPQSRRRPQFTRFQLPKDATEKELAEFLEQAIRQVLAAKDPCDQATNNKKEASLEA